VKASAFLKLVGEMMSAQQQYFKTRAQINLIAAKEFEHRVLKVVKEGVLEPDEPATTVSAEEE
jgi:hypothetical protein